MSENRLGLALSGGGFRASLFHLGVLRRLAELGLLPHVTHISTVSGGSVVAAHYYLHFKKKYEAKEGFLEDPDYVEIVKAVEAEVIRGVDADLRNSLLWNPLSHLEEFTLGNGYGRRMARLYTKHFYRNVTRELDWKGVDPETRADYSRRGIPLHRAVIRRPDQAGLADSRSSSYPNSGVPERALVDFNTDETRLANIPSLVMNSTCLNTGGPFLFTLNEVGGSECGYVRMDEVFMLLQFKYILDCLGTKPVDVGMLNDAMEKAVALGKELQNARPELPPTALTTPGFTAQHLRDHFYLYQAAKARKEEPATREDDFWAPEAFRFTSEDATLRALMCSPYWPSVRHLLDTSWGLLRRAKVAAWHLLDDHGWATADRRAGLTREDYEAEFKNALANIDEVLVRDFAQDGKFDATIQSLVLDFYYFRSAEVLDRSAHHTLHEITLSHAVAASANFPPVFAPFKIFSLFEKNHVTSLSLTDGGVHDNQGVDALLDAGCTHIIISDAGGLVRHEETADDARIPMMDRVIELLMGGLRHVMMRSVRHSCSVSKVLKHAPDVDELRELRRTTHLREAEVIHMTSDPSDVRIEGLKPFAAREVAALRTDLDVFNELEIAALRHQGYQLADRYARTIRESLGITSFVPRAESPAIKLPPAPTPEHIGVLKAGAHRFARYSVARPLHAIILSLAVAVAVLALTAADVENDNGHWSSWSSLIELLNDNVLDWVRDSEERVSPRERLEPNPIWNRAITFRNDIIDVARKISLVTVIFGGWGLALLGSVLFRGARAVARDPQLIELTKLARRNRSRPVFTRTWNIISMICLALFLLTLNVRWLLGIVQLWSVPLAVTFGLVHLMFTPLWRSSGRLTPRKPPNRPGAPRRAPVPV